ncbi:MAG: hypothetical protein ACE10D_00250 [Planctomycetota bacterium]
MRAAPLTLLFLLALVYGARAANDREAALVQALGAADPTRRTAAYSALLRIGADAAPALVAGLEHSDPEISRSCRSLLIRVADASAPLLREREHSSRARDLLQELERRNIAHVCLLLYGPGLDSVFRGQLFVAAGKQGVLPTADGSGPGSEGPAAEVIALADRGAPTWGVPPLGRISVRLDGWDDGHHVVPQGTHAELRHLKGISRRRVFCLALVKRCSLLERERAAPDRGRRLMEQALADALAAGRLHTAAEAYWEATGSRGFATTLRTHREADSALHTAGVLARTGDPDARRAVLAVCAGRRKVPEAARRSALRACATLKGDDVVAAIRTAALAGEHSRYLPVLVQRLAILDEDGATALEIFRDGPRELRPDALTAIVLHPRLDRELVEALAAEITPDEAYLCVTVLPYGLSPPVWASLYEHGGEWLRLWVLDRAAAAWQRDWVERDAGAVAAMRKRLGAFPEEIYRALRRAWGARGLHTDDLFEIVLEDLQDEIWAVEAEQLLGDLWQEVELRQARRLLELALQAEGQGGVRARRVAAERGAPLPLDLGDPRRAEPLFQWFPVAAEAT